MCVSFLGVCSFLIITQTGRGTMVWLGRWSLARGSGANKALLPQVWERLHRMRKWFVFFHKVRHLLCLLEGFDSIDRACSLELVQSRASG